MILMKRILRKYMKIEIAHEHEIISSLDNDEFLNELMSFAENNPEFLRIVGKNKLKARNYVGLIKTKSGVLEIYPKVSKPSNEIMPRIDLSKAYELKDEMFKDCKERELNPKQLLLELLRTLQKSPFKKSLKATLKDEKMSLFEVFVEMFLEELFVLLNKGLMSDYIKIAENRTTLKGKLLFNENLKHNLIHKERFFTENDEYIIDNAINQTIKTTLFHLKKLSQNKKILKYLKTFDDISLIDIKKCEFSVKNKHYSYYENILLWCKLFLNGFSFTPFAGDNNAYALLFDMNRLFEDYVAFMLKKHNPNIKISAQLLKKHLIKDGQNERCLMRPDILIELKDKTIITDTKYKIINKLSDISQADLYQLFAYAIAFKVSEVWLIYPLFDGSLGYKTLEYNLDYFNTKIKLQILFAPLG